MTEESTQTLPPRRPFRDALTKTALLGALTASAAGLRSLQNDPPLADTDCVSQASKQGTVAPNLSPEEAYVNAWYHFDRALADGLKEVSDKSSGVSKAALLGGVKIRMNVGADTVPADCVAHVSLLGMDVPLPAVAKAFDAYAELCRCRNAIADGSPALEAVPEVPGGKELIQNIIERFQSAAGVTSVDKDVSVWAEDIFNAAVRARGIRRFTPASAHVGFLPPLRHGSNFSHSFTADLLLTTRDVPVQVTIEKPRRMSDLGANITTASSFSP